MIIINFGETFRSADKVDARHLRSQALTVTIRATMTPSLTRSLTSSFDKCRFRYRSSQRWSRYIQIKKPKQPWTRPNEVRRSYKRPHLRRHSVITNKTRSTRKLQAAKTRPLITRYRETSPECATFAKASLLTRTLSTPANCARTANSYNC